MELSQNKKALLKGTVKDLLASIVYNEELSHVRQSAFDSFITETKEQVQVHVIVTRNQNDFLDFLETEEMTLM